MPAAKSQVAEDARTFDVYEGLGRNVTATMREEVLARNTVKNRVRRHESRMREAAAWVALDYAMFEAEFPKGSRLMPCEREFVFNSMRRHYGRDYAAAMISDRLVAITQTYLPRQRRLVASGA